MEGIRLKLLYICLLDVLLERCMCEVVAYSVTRGITWKEYRLGRYMHTHQRCCLEER